ncbi:MAG: hypothetical protein M5U28_42365 [Sandaracinaceae bacterium]|nr:hypothetical protein [Sandaracinaceae bacterium]
MKDIVARGQSARDAASRTRVEQEIAALFTSSIVPERLAALSAAALLKTSNAQDLVRRGLRDRAKEVRRKAALLGPRLRTRGTSPRQLSPTPTEHIAMEQHHSVRFTIVGLGQCGSQIAASFAALGYPAVVVNTSYTDLAAVPHVPEAARVYVGLHGRDGTGKDTSLGEYSLRESAEVVRAAVQVAASRSDALLLCGGLGGGTGGCPRGAGRPAGASGPAQAGRLRHAGRRRAGAGEGERRARRRSSLRRAARRARGARRRPPRQRARRRSARSRLRARPRRLQRARRAERAAQHPQLRRRRTCGACSSRAASSRSGARRSPSRSTRATSPRRSAR